MTIEGLGQGLKPHPVQQAFPGSVSLSVRVLHTWDDHGHGCTAEKKRILTLRFQDIRQELAGNVCRCGTYSRIIKAVGQAAEGEQHA